MGTHDGHRAAELLAEPRTSTKPITEILDEARTRSPAGPGARVLHARASAADLVWRATITV